MALDDELIPTADATVTSLPKSCLRKLDPRRWWRRRQRYLAKIRGCRFSCLQDLEYFKPSCTCALAQCWWKAWCSRKSAKGGSPKGNFAVLEDCRLPGPVPAAPATAAAAAALAGDGKGTQKCAPAPGKFSQLVDCRTLAMPEPHKCCGTRLSGDKALPEGEVGWFQAPSHKVAEVRELTLPCVQMCSTSVAMKVASFHD